MSEEDGIHGQAQELAAVLRGLQRRLTVLDENDPTIGMPIAQLRVCGILQDGPLPVCALSRELGISASAVTQIANRLQRAGMVERIPDPEDRRVRSLVLTTHGREAMQARRQRRVERIQSALGGIAPPRRGEILDAMRDLLEAAGEKD